MKSIIKGLFTLIIIFVIVSMAIGSLTGGEEDYADNSSANWAEEPISTEENDVGDSEDEYSRTLSKEEKLEIIRYIEIREHEIGEDNYTEEDAEKVWKEAENKFHIVEYDIRLLMLDVDLLREVYAQGLY